MTTYRIYEPCSFTALRWLDWDGTVDADTPDEALDRVATDGGWDNYLDWRRDGKPRLVVLPEVADEDDDWEYPGYDGPRCVECGCPVDSGNACGACLRAAIAATERYEEVDL